MWSKTKSFLKRFFFPVVVSGSFLFISYAFLKWFVGMINDSAPNIGAAIIAALTGIITVTISQYHSKMRQIRDAHRAEKSKLYQRFMDIIFKILDLTKQKKSEQEMATELNNLYMDFTKDLIVWGGVDVISKYERFRELSINPQGDNVLLLADDVLQAFRKDLEIGNWGLSRGDLVKLFLRNPTELDAMIAETDKSK